MKVLVLRVAAFLMLAFAGAGANAALLRFDFSGPTVIVRDWAGPGPPPTSFELSFTVDTLSFTSSEVWYFGDTPPYEPSPDGTGEISQFRFSGLDVLSISLVANGEQLWDEPAGLKLLLFGDMTGVGPDPGKCLCALGYGANSLGQYVGTNKDSRLPPRSELGDDPVAAILLALSPFGGQGMHIQGEWGYLVGNDELYVSAVPAPATVWLLGTGLAGLGGRRWLRRNTF